MPSSTEQDENKKGFDLDQMPAFKNLLGEYQNGSELGFDSEMEYENGNDNSESSFDATYNGNFDQQNANYVSDFDDVGASRAYSVVSYN